MASTQTFLSPGPASFLEARWSRLQGRPGRLARAAVPALALGLASAYLWAPATSYPGRLQVPLHLLFVVLAPLCAAILLQRRFQALGEPAMLLLGFAAAVWCCTGVVNCYVIAHVNTMVSVHNIGAWCASLFHLAAVGLGQGRLQPLGRRPWWSAGALLVAVVLPVLIFAGARLGLLPVLFIQGHGGTPVRQFVLGLSVGTYLLAAAILLLRPRLKEQAHVQWYALFLLLFGLGLFGTLVQRSAASVLGWTGRAGQYLGALYLVRTAWAASQERSPERLSFAQAFGGQTLKYLVAICVVLVSTAFRLVFLGELGSQFDYLTYFPAVTMSALYGGLRAGIVSTLLSCLLSLLFLRPAGGGDLPLRFTGISILVFLASGGLVSLIVENMHRARAQAAAAEARAAAALERERAAATLRQTVDELQRSNRELEQFAYVASHDLQEPLRMVLVFLGRLGESCKDRLSDKEALYLASARGGAERMRVLIHDLLAYSRVGAQAREAAPVALQDALDQALENLAEAIREAGAQVTQDPLPIVQGNRPQLTQILQNLLGNAIKFRAADPAAIHVSARHQGSQWLCSVEDNGIGLDPRFGERIFELFQRLHTGDQHPGTGIGLAICRKIVECHGGSIWVESRPGRGSTFFFTLPDPTGSAP